MTNLVSIIIPTKNRSVVLLNTIKSFQLQSYKCWELIIIDDTGDEKLLKDFGPYLINDKRITIYPRPSLLKSGASACRNYGLTKARGEFIQFFDDDDFPYPDMLSIKAEKLIGTGADVVVHPLEVYKKGSEKPIINKVHSKDLIRSYLRSDISWYVSGPMWRKKWLEEKFDENIGMLDDWDFNLRNLYKKPSIIYIDKPLAKYLNNCNNRLSQEVTEKNLNSQFFTITKHIRLYKKKISLEKYDLKKYFLNRLIYILRTALLKKYDSAKYFYKVLMEEWGNSFYLSKIRIKIGVLSYFLFNKGYRFLNKIE